jgi:hypothetical protein
MTVQNYVSAGEFDWPVEPVIPCLDPQSCGEFCMGKCRKVTITAEACPHGER